MKIEVTEQEKNELKEIVNLLKTDYASEAYKLGRNLAISLKDRFKGYYIYYKYNSFDDKEPTTIDPETLRPEQFRGTFDFDYIINRIELDSNWQVFYGDIMIIEFIRFIQLVIKEDNNFVRKK